MKHVGEPPCSICMRETSLTISRSVPRSQNVVSASLLTVVLLLAGCTTVSFHEKELFEGAGRVEEDPLPGVERTFITLSDGTGLETWVVPAPTPRAVLLFFSGNGGLSKAHLPFFREAVARWDLTVVAVHYRGYGRSGGSPTIETLASDPPEVLRLVKARYAPDLPLIVAGHSLGGYAALRCAGMPEADAFLIVATFTTSAELAEAWRKNLVPWYAAPFVRIDVDEEVLTLDNYEAVARVRVPIAFVHGTEDDVIPSWMSARLHTTCPSPHTLLRTIPDADHNTPLLPRHRQPTLEALAFLLSHLPR